MFTKKFWKDLAERTARTFVQGAAAFVTAAGIDLIQADVTTVLYGGLIAGGYAVVTALAAHFKNPEQQTASLLDQPVATAPPGRHNGSQAPYNASLEGYTDGPAGNVQPYKPGVSYDEPKTGPSQPMGFVATPTATGPEVRQRDPKTGRFLPRNLG